MKRFVILVLPVIISVIVILIKVPEIENWLKDHHRHSGLFIAFFLAFSTIFIHVITVYSPFKKYERVAKNKWKIVETFAGKLISDLDTNGYKKFSFNLMVPKRVWWYHKLHPRIPAQKEVPDSCKPEKLTHCWFGQIFKVACRYGPNFDNRLKMSVKQGAPGLAFASGKIKIINLGSHGDLTVLNLNRKQVDIITGNDGSGEPGLQFMLSYPVFAFNNEYRNQTSKVIGIINISSHDANGLNFIADEQKRGELIENIILLSEICGYVM